MLTSGHLLADRYRLARRIAVGGMGEVWEAEDARLDRRVAVKVLKAELCGDAEFLHRFRTEARTTASLNHPGVAGVHDYGETAALANGPQDTAYLVMELVEGEPLSAVLARDGRLSVERTLDMLEQSGHALQAAHSRGLVHRDIKPGNILLTPTGVVKLTDFGIAKAADAAPVTRSGMVMGTAHYIAPEQAVGHEAEPASDVYSLAVVGYECLAGHRPFLSENAVTVAMMHIRDLPPPLPHDVPPGVRALIEATLAKDPRKRYPTGGEFAVAVVAVRTGYPLPTPSSYPMGSGYAMDEDTPPTGIPALSPRLAATGPHTGPHTGPNTGPNTGGMLPPIPRQRPRAWLWLLIVLLFMVAAGLTVWSVVATNAKGGSGSEQPRGQVRTSQAPPAGGSTGDERPPEAGAGPGGAGSGAGSGGGADTGGQTGSGRADNGTRNNGGGRAAPGSGHRYGSPGGPGNGAGGDDTGGSGGGAAPTPTPKPTDGGGTKPTPSPTDHGGIGRRIAPAPSKPFNPPTTGGSGSTSVNNGAQ